MGLSIHVGDDRNAWLTNVGLGQCSPVCGMAQAFSQAITCWLQRVSEQCRNAIYQQTISIGMYARQKCLNLTRLLVTQDSLTKSPASIMNCLLSAEMLGSIRRWAKRHKRKSGDETNMAWVHTRALLGLAACRKYGRPQPQLA